MTDIATLLAQAKEAIAGAGDLPTLDQIRVQFLGKKGLITESLKTLNTLAEQERRQFGQVVNEAKLQIQNLIQEKLDSLKEAKLEQLLKSQSLDVTLPGRGLEQGHFHPITRARERIEAFFGGLGFAVAQGPEIEHEFYNFNALNMPSHHPARAMHDTFYVDDTHVLRTHTSPVQIRYMLQTKPPFRMIAPGRTYRCDSDMTHTPMFHQFEGLMVDEHTNFADLKGLLNDFMNYFFERDLPMRFRASYFPFTEPSAEADIQCIFCEGKGCRVCKNTGWLEVLGCGMVHPNVLKAGAVDSERFIGYAFGGGIERLAMLRYGVDDLRLFFENDLRLLKQF